MVAARSIQVVLNPFIRRATVQTVLNNAYSAKPLSNICCIQRQQRLFHVWSAVNAAERRTADSSPSSGQPEKSSFGQPSKPIVPLPSNKDTKKLAQAILTGGKESNVIQKNPGRSVHFRMGQLAAVEESPNSKPASGQTGEKNASLKSGILASAKFSKQKPFVAGEDVPLGQNAMHHPVYTEAELDNVYITHHKPENFVDKAAYYTVQAMRFGFDVISGYKFGTLTEAKWLNRIIFLETVAAVPGMVGGMIRHLNSLRRMKRDYGWIHSMLEEAENERMHLMTALHLRQPGPLFRGCVLVTQGIFVNFFFIAYLLSNRYCHRFVGYLEEEAVKTYTHCLSDIDSGRLEVWRLKRAPKSAIRYWRLREDATMRDMIRNIRADEAHHRVVNHTLAAIQSDTYNPFRHLPQYGKKSEDFSSSSANISSSDSTPKFEDGKIPRLQQKSDKRDLPTK